MIWLRTSFEITEVEQELDVDPELLEYVEREFERECLREEGRFLIFLAAAQEAKE